MIPPWRTKFRIKGYLLGSELITVAADRDFSAGVSNWTVEAGDDVTWDNTDCDWNCNELNTIRLAVTLTEGALYKVQFDISAYTSGNIGVYLGGATAHGVSESVDTFVLYVLAEASNYIQFGGTDFIGSIDNISIKEVI